MCNIKIEKIRLHNFKGVDDMDISISDISALILGGKNGFGKTTIFDALELVLTERIARYSEYRDTFIDGRRAYSQEERPLVCSMDVPDISIEVTVSIDLGDGHVERRILSRNAMTADMKNPIDFDVFRELKIREMEAGQSHVATKEELDALGLSTFREQFDTLNYMSQEEATHFIKSKDTKRVEAVQFLFNTLPYDSRINKIDKMLLKGLKEKTDALRQQKQQKEQTIQALRQYGSGEAGEANGYQRLFQGGTAFNWDAEQPNLSHEEYAQLLREGGLLDSILHVITHQEDYRRWKNCQAITRLLEKTADYAYYLQYHSRESAFLLWRDYQRETAIPFAKLELQHIQEYQFVVNERLRDLAGLKKLEAIQEQLRLVKEDYKAATETQRAYDEMLEQRNRLANHLKAHADQLTIQRCPLCGQSYETMQKLQDSVESTLQLQLSSFTVLNDQVSKNYARLKEMVNEVVEVLNSSFQERGVTPAVIARYNELDKEKISRNVQLLREKGILADLPKAALAETERAFREELQTKLQDYNVELGYDTMKPVYDGYVRYIAQDLRNVDSIQQKRIYLQQFWNRRKSQQMEQLTQDVTAIDRKMAQYNQLESQLKQIRDAIVAQKNAYLRKVITDVEILFYIYSGRIMQDSFYGRGLFMKNVQGKYIYFVSKYNSDVDALYKMSSGQLVALMLALLLSLNKLYSRSKFLAIDDPVQTIDDINAWGFTETLRHEFRDYQFLFSTHELSYGSFLRYKLSNMKIDARYVDMMELRKSADILPEG